LLASPKQADPGSASLLSAPTQPSEASLASSPDVTADGVRTPGDARRCPVCGAVLTGQQQSACSPRCRRELARQRERAATAVALDVLRQRVAEVEAENQGLRQRLAGLADAPALRQRVAALTNLVAHLNRRRPVRP
jgi:predicted nucleic acid-binding Zn ribbon protein